MPKFLITRRSHNRITGPILVTTSPRTTCPHACPLRKQADGPRAGSCYAENGFLGGFIWKKLDELEPGQSFKTGQIRVYDLPELLTVIEQLPPHTLWRHNQAGDLYTKDGHTIDQDVLFQIVSANFGRRGFTYTHFDPLDIAENRRLIKEANAAGFTINLSANSERHADQLASLGIGPVAVVLPSSSLANFDTQDGHRIVICPARVEANLSCATCGICANQRKAVVGLPAVGGGAKRINV